MSILNKSSITALSLLALMITSAIMSVPFSNASTVLFSENFNFYPNGSQPSGWYHDRGFSVINGTYVAMGKGGYTVAFYTGAKFANFTLTVTATGLPGCAQQPPVLGIVFRMQDRINGYWFWGDIDKLGVVKWVAGSGVTLPNMASTGGSVGQINPTGTFNMTVIANGDTIKAIWNNKQTLMVRDSTFKSGYVGVGTYNCNSAFDNLIVTNNSAFHSPTSTSTTSTTELKSSSTSTTSTTVTTTITSTTTRSSTTTISSTSANRVPGSFSTITINPIPPIYGPVTYTGVLYDQNGTPLPNRGVQLAVANSTGHLELVLQTATTNSNGAFSFSERLTEAGMVYRAIVATGSNVRTSFDFIVT